MSKAFVKEDADDDDDVEPPEPSGPAPRNYITPAGHARMKRELLHLLDVERPEVVRIVSWAASNGDRSENGDYLYGKKRLREIDRRIRFLTRRLDRAEVVDPLLQAGNDQVFFGATVTYLQSDGVERTVRIVGVDEVDPLRGQISWVSPVAKALIKAREGDSVPLMTPGGRLDLDIVEVRYFADDGPPTAG
jgi:transcription elongation factor GreB